jgi:flagellar biosynthesis GTPase FlhF
MQQHYRASSTRVASARVATGRVVGGVNDGGSNGSIASDAPDRSQNGNASGRRSDDSEFSAPRSGGGSLDSNGSEDAAALAAARQREADEREAQQREAQRQETQRREAAARQERERLEREQREREQEHEAAARRERQQREDEERKSPERGTRRGRGGDAASRAEIETPEIDDDTAQRMRTRTVTIKVRIRPDGSFEVWVAKSSGSGEYDERYLQKAKRGRYKPAVRDGEPVTTVRSFTYVIKN